MSVSVPERAERGPRPCAECLSPAWSLVQLPSLVLVHELPHVT
jgi:hypothetical protein